MQLISCVGRSQLTGGEDVKSAFLYQQTLKDLLCSFRNELNEITPCPLAWFATELERSGLSFHIML